MRAKFFPFVATGVCSCARVRAHHPMPDKSTGPPRFPISIEIDGKTHSGDYFVEGSMVTVEYRAGVLSKRKAKQVGIVAPVVIARIPAERARARGACDVARTCVGACSLIREP